MRLRSYGLLRIITCQFWLLPAAATLPLCASPVLTCAPVASKTHPGLEPVMRGPFANPSLLSDLEHSYRTLYSFPPPAALQALEPRLESALKLSISTGNSCGEALAAYALGDIAERIHIAEAAPWFERAAAAFADASSTLGVGKSHLRLAYVHAMQGHEASVRGEYASAANELEQAGDSTDAISARLGALEDNTPDSAGFAALLNQAQSLSDPCIEADVLRSWGDHAHREAQYQAAMTHYQAAELLYKRCPAEPASRAALQTSMGRLERQQGRPAAALSHYRLALRLQQQSGDPSYIPQTYNAMAVAYEAMKDDSHAISLYKLGLEEARRLHSQPFIDFLSANLGSTYARTGHPSLGIPLLEASTQHLTSDYLICIRFDQLGGAYLAAGHPHEAAARLDTAVAACEREATKDSLADALSDRARTRMENNQLDAAWADASRALSIVEEFRAHLVQTDAYKQGYITAGQTRSTYNLAITVLMRMKRYRQALEVAEQGRARALLDLLASEQSNAPHASASTAGAISSPEHTGALTVDEMLAEAARLHTTIVAYWLTDSSLYTWVARPGEPVLGFSQTVRPVLIEKLVRATLPLAVDSGSGPPLTPPSDATPNPSRPETVAARGSSFLSGPPSAAWRRLYALLIAPITSALPAEEGSLLTIVPSGPLFRVSFAALLDQRGHYLVERYRTHTIPMVGLLRYTQRNLDAAASRPPHFLFIGAPRHLPTGPDGLPLPALPGTAAEIHAVAMLLPPPQVTVLSGAAATQARVERAAPSSTYIHFATHAVVDSDHPENTYLALDNSQGDGRLSLDEVYALHLQARLVVLSACRTGLGKITGDGVAGLSRAFFYAGSASVLTTLWDVADQPTAVLLPRFYRALESGQSPSEALRNAQLSMLRDLRRGRVRIETLRGPIALPPSPVYWAAFTLTGEP